ncbi:MAG TPA: PqqD family peptide modification chaperone [Blastocatellia bacterium]|nr:PqqD family peptide modification chaperone [Blastocatellia bacterium]
MIHSCFTHTKEAAGLKAISSGDHFFILGDGEGMIIISKPELRSARVEESSMAAAQANRKVSLKSIVVASPDQISSDLAEEVIILDLKSGMYYGLDPVGAMIWDLLQSPRSVEEIRDTLLNEYTVERDRCERDLMALLDDLLSRSLIEVRDGTGS